MTKKEIIAIVSRFALLAVMLSTIAGFMTLVHIESSDRVYAQRYCSVYDMDLVDYQAIEPMYIICENETAELTVVWE